MLKLEQIVYVVETIGRVANIRLGIVDSLDKNCCIVDFLVIKEHRYVKGTPIDEFKTTEWKSYPKVFREGKFREKFEPSVEVVWRLSKRDQELLRALRIDGVADMEEAYKEKLLVRASEVTDWDVRVEINRNNEYRIVKSIPAWTQTYGKDKRTFVHLPKDKVYPSYELAQKAVKEWDAKWAKLDALTDFEWSVREIDKVLKQFPEEDRERYREILLSMPDIEDLEVRKRDGVLWYRWFTPKTEWEQLALA
jgi:hypothetical protein